jgi:hypothetical protein
MLIVHSVSANIYYKINHHCLQMAADRAVRAGRNYLPTDPGAAVYVADEYARLGGVGPDEIAITRVSPDNRTLTILLRRRVPWYVALLAVGLPAREMAVSASVTMAGRNLQAALQKRRLGI